MSTIKLPNRCDRAAAEALLPDLVGLPGNDRIEFDGTEVDQIGQSMLQLLVSARRSGAGARIAGSPALVAAATMTGLHDELFGEI